MGGTVAAASAQWPVEHVKNTLQNIANEGTPHIVHVCDFLSNKYVLNHLNHQGLYLELNTTYMKLDGFSQVKLSVYRKGSGIVPGMVNVYGSKLKLINSGLHIWYDIKRSEVRLRLAVELSQLESAQVKP